MLSRQMARRIKNIIYHENIIKLDYGRLKLMWRIGLGVFGRTPLEEPDLQNVW
jgi:hypothetical protein